VAFNPEKSKELFQRAHLLIKSGHNDKEALSLLLEIIKIHEPNHVAAHMWAANLYLKNKNHDGVRMVLDHLDKSRTADLETLLIRTRSEIDQKQFDDAQMYLDRVFLLKRDDVDAVLLKGIILLNTKKYDEAQRIFLSLLDRIPSNTELIYNLALSYYAKKDFGNCLLHLDNLMNSQSRNPKFKKLHEEALKRVVHNHVESELSDKSKSYLSKLILQFKNLFFDAGLVRAVQRQAVADARDNARDIKLYKDEMTGAFSKEAFPSYVSGFYAQRKTDESLYVFMVDLDYFASFNNCYGHGIGDLVVKALGATGQRHFPGRFFRVGGEEFAWAIESSSEQDVLDKAEAFRKDLENNAIKTVNDQIIATVSNNFRYPDTDPIESRRGELILLHNPVTISQGGAIYGKDGNIIEEVAKAADGGLYIAKDLGRNCVVFRTQLTTKGKSPTKYTREMLKLLDLQAIAKGHRDWWTLSEKLKEDDRNVMIDNARLTSEGQGKRS